MPCQSNVRDVREAARYALKAEGFPVPLVTDPSGAGPLTDRIASLMSVVRVRYRALERKNGIDGMRHGLSGYRFESLYRAGTNADADEQHAEFPAAV